MPTEWERALPPSPLAALRRDLPRPWLPAFSAGPTSCFPPVPLLPVPPVLSPVSPGVLARARDFARVSRDVALAILFVSFVFCVFCVLSVLLSALLVSVLVMVLSACFLALPRLWLLSLCLFLLSCLLLFLPFLGLLLSLALPAASSSALVSAWPGVPVRSSGPSSESTE